MRTFVATVRAHLAAAGCTNDDRTVWEILRRFQILAFDYDAPGSQSLELALERARHVLQPDDASRGSVFWKALTETAIRAAASGGDLDRARLLGELALVDNFRMLGSRRNRAPRETLSQDADLAAADLRRNIAGVSLARIGQLDAVRKSRDAGRYVEIRGGAGVGKSGLLGTLVQQVLTEACAIVLSPDRTIPGGWLAFKSALGVDTSPQAFLSDLASDGGAVLFVDSLDFFDDAAKRATVIDLVRSAAGVPNFEVIVTARSDFDKEEPNWLPLDALASLGRAPPIMVTELGVEEIEELKAAAPALRALLADKHPARDIARNLFRLSRLLEVQGSTEELRSEVDLLERWWTTADGALKGRRERARLLSDLSDAALTGGVYIETRASPIAVEALIASETLRELGLDRLTFQHDVLRDWGVAARLHDDPTKLDHLPLTRPAPASLARGVEIGARLALERSEDSQRWVSYLDRIGSDGAHPSWRRWSLLAILRSELSFMLLDRAAESLFERDGALLQELIRTAIAVECRPLSELVSEIRADPAAIPAGIYGPSNGSWAKLVSWLLARRADLPIQVLPDLVELFQSLSASMFFADSLTPRMATALVDWLEEIEDAQEHYPLAKDHPRFYRYHNLSELAENVRHAFALMAARIPERAQSYIRGVLSRRHPDHAIRDILRFRGFLAQTAPAELVDLTIAGLVPKQKKKERSYRRLWNEIFTHLNAEFLPSSPAQGPFLELLNAAPEQGLKLIRHLVNHAVAVLSHGREPSHDGLTILFPSGQRFFPWQHTYYWSRHTNGYYAIESGLMALEAWSHARVERGDAPDQVIRDILGPEGSPTAFLLIVVDVLISHWPKTKHVATPFLGSPEMLALDRTRQAHDSILKVDLLGWDSIMRKEPSGPIRLANLKERPSRRFALETLLINFAHSDGADRDELRHLLQTASAQLGDPEPDDTFADPRLMARHALNLIDPANWQPTGGGLAYVSPPEEAEHVANLQAESAPRMLDVHVDAAIQNALEDKEQSSPNLANQAVAYAKRLELAADTPDAALCSRANAIVSAAMIAARDGADKFLDEHEDWVRYVFATALAANKQDLGSHMRDGIRFNTDAIATFGLIHLWRRRRRDADRDALLDVAGRDTAGAAQGFGAGLEILRELDQRVIPAVLRCALAAQIRPTYQWDDPEEKKAADHLRYRERVTAVIAAERAWLSGDAEEPTWPLFPPQTIHIERGPGIGGDDAVRLQTALDPANDPANDNVRSSSAALWVRQLAYVVDPRNRDWLAAFIMAYAEWTTNANGAGLGPQVEIDNRPDEWNKIFYRLLACAIVHLKLENAAAELARAVAVPDKSFYDIAAELVPAVDRLYFNGLGFNLDMTLSFRGLVAERLMETAGWQRERDQSKFSVEMRIGPAIGVLFFNDYVPFSGTRCYLRHKDTDQIDPFLPQLTRLIEDGPVPFTVLLVMNLLEVSHKPKHAGFFLSSALTWLQRQPRNTLLWVDGGFGARLAKWLELVTASDPSLRSAAHPLRAQLDEVLARLVQVGVPEAHKVERALANGNLG